jgi:hypothetical protein
VLLVEVAVVAWLLLRCCLGSAQQVGGACCQQQLPEQNLPLAAAAAAAAAAVLRQPLLQHSPLPDQPHAQDPGLARPPPAAAAAAAPAVEAWLPSSVSSFGGWQRQALLLHQLQAGLLQRQRPTPVWG